jgi:mono/diheme cytochrome c family protein
VTGYKQAFIGSLIVLSAGCSYLERPTRKDPLAVAEHYNFRQTDVCSSWLQSNRTGYYYCASPPVKFDYEADAITARPEIYKKAVAAGGGEPKSKKTGPVDKASLMAHGKVVYQTCAACHQGNGQGLPGAFPPLKGAGDFYGGPKKHAGIILNGLSGEIEVNGAKFNGVMPPQGPMLTNYDVAAVATYERHSWGNDDGIVLPKHVEAARK